MENKTRNFYFELYKIDSNELLDMVRLRLVEDIMTPFKEFIDEIYYSYEGANIKQQLSRVCPEVIEVFNDKIGKDILSDVNIEINLVGPLEYRSFDKEYDNECKFVEYINSEKAKIDKSTNISVQILLDNGFVQCNDAPWMKIEYNPYPTYFRKCTTDKDGDQNFIKLDITEGMTNNGAQWHMHIDNNRCETIGSADIDNVWQFNTLMEIFGSKFRL